MGALYFYISRSIKEEEPPLFAEPGLFLIRPDATLYCASVQTMPFARPSFSEVLQAVAFVAEKNYPARGEAWPRTATAVRKNERHLSSD